VEHHGETSTLIAKELSGMGGDEPGEIQRSISRTLAADEVAKLQALLE